MSSTQQHDPSAQGYRDTVIDRLREEGHEDIAAWYEGMKRLNEFDLSDFLALVDDAWVVQLVGADATHQFTRATDGNLVRANDTAQDGEFARPHQSYVPEFGDYLFSGQYRIELLFPDHSAFEVADDE